MNEDTEIEKKSMSTLHVLYRIWSYYPPRFPVLFVSAGLFSLLTAVLPFVLSRAQGNFVDSLIASLTNVASSDFSRLYMSLAVLVTCFLFIAIIDFIFDYIVNAKLFYANHTATAKMCMEKKALTDLSFFDDSKKMTLLHHVDEARNLVAENIKFTFLSLVVSLVSFGVSAIILGLFSWQLVLVVFTTMMPFAYILYSNSTEEVIRWKNKKKLMKFSGDINRLFDTNNTLTEIKVFGLVKKLVTRYVKFRDIIDGELVAISKKYLYLKIIGTVIRYGGVAFAIILLIQNILAKTTTVGQGTFYLATIFAFGKATQELFVNLARLRQELLQISTVFEFMDMESSFPKTDRALPQFDKAPRIVFDSVGFGYIPEKQTVKNISFTIEPGEKVAVVGLNGAGKSTVIKLLCRMYDPSVGEITIDGIPLRDCSADSWYKNLSVVFQDFGRYEFTVEETIAIASEGNIDSDRVIESARMADIDTKIQDLPQGYKTQLGTKFPGGVALSVGQWQKIAIARALYRGTKIIILDEPTSSVDAEAEEQIFNTLHTLSGETTVIFVSHRFSTILQADKIIFIADGTINCVGSHDYLMHNSPEYKKLYELQSKAYSYNESM